MAKPKAQTLQQRFGFKDTDLTTPLHDEIMLWLDENIKRIIEEYPFHQKCIDHEWDNAQKSNVLSITEQPENLYAIWDIVKVWERPITDTQRYSSGHRAYTIGFVDLSVSYKRHRLGKIYDEHDKQRYSLWHENESLNFEVKTTIPSLGELFRQIRMYQTYTHDSFIIVSPDDRFQMQIESQGLHFLKYEPDRFREVVF